MQPLVLLTRICPAFANSVDPDQLKRPTDLDLHCLSWSISIYINNPDQEIDWLKIRSGHGITIYSAWQGLTRFSFDLAWWPNFLS